MAIPIWKDKVVTLSGTGAFNIRLNTASGAIIYSGKAEQIGGTRKVRINDICADYIANNLPRFGETYGNNFTTTFCIEQGGVAVEIVTFYWNWSYDYDFVDDEYDEEEQPIPTILSAPIRKEIPAWIQLPFCVNMAGSITIARTGYADTPATAKTPNNFNYDASQDTAYYRVGSIIATSAVYYNVIASAGAGTSISVRGVEYYRATNMCAKYAIYYLNAYGGWDVLAINGNTRVSMAFSRTLSGRWYDNTHERADGQITAVNEETRRFTFNTGWVDDLGASRMHHLLGTTKAYLYEIATGKIVPMTITNSEAVVKTARQDGMLNYEITAEVAQSFARR